MITIILKIDDMERKIVHLVLTNESTDKVFHVPSERIGIQGRKLSGNYFEFNEPVPFLGTLTKREPYLQEELIGLLPQESITTDFFDLHELYDLSSVSSALQFRYKASTTLFPPEQMMIASQWVILE